MAAKLPQEDLTAEWLTPTHIFIGHGEVNNLKHHIKHMGLQSLLVISDRGMALSVPLKKLLRHLERAQISFGVFSHLDGPANSSILEQSIRVYRKGAFDGIIAFGGGTTIELAKLTALFSATDYDYHNLLVPPKNVASAPVIAIPTLAGSGAEVEASAYIAPNAMQAGQRLNDKRLLPDRVILDPKLTALAPAHLIAGAGMHAFAHAVDSWCAPSFNPAADALSVTTIRSLFTHLAKAVQDKNNIVAHSHLHSASVSGAMAAAKGLGATIALSHSICQRYHCHFGMTAAVLLPYILAFNRPVIEQRINLLSHYCDIKGGFNGFFQHLIYLRKEIGVPAKLTGLLKEQKIKAKDKAFIDDIATEDPAADENPIRFNKKAALKVLNAALNGKLS